MALKPVKNEQIIVRLSPKKKKRLQEIADDLKIDMSKLIRDKIDEIINEYDKVKTKTNDLTSNNYTENGTSYCTPKIVTEIVKQMISNDNCIKKMIKNIAQEEMENTDDK